MPRLARPLTDVAARKATARAASYTLAAGGGLYLRIAPTGVKTWEVRYRRQDGSRPAPARIGTYPEMGCAEARLQADTVHSRARQGLEVLSVRALRSEVRRAEAQAAELAAAERIDAERYRFAAVAARWLEDRRRRWAPETYRKARLISQTWLAPAIGAADIRTLGRAAVLPALASMAAQVPVLARKARQHIASIVRYAIDHGLRDEGRGIDLSGTLDKHTGGHMPAATHADELADVVRAVARHPNRVTRSALQLVAWTALRPGIVASLRWSEVHLKAAELRIAGTNPDGSRRMKTGHAHVVSLPRQALAMLAEMRLLSAGGDHVFPAQARQQTPHLHRDALSKALRDAGLRGKHVTHGWRASLRTIGRERLGIDIDLLEAQLAHAKRGEVQAAYDRTGFVEQRRAVMQLWADHLDELAALDDAQHSAPARRCA
jgi:integrase